jgi:hypothetical protein
LAPAPAEDEQIAGVRITAQTLLNLERQPVHAASHVGDAAGEPNPHSGRNRDHARLSRTSRRRAKTTASKPGPTMTQRPFASAISMRPAAVGAGLDSADEPLPKSTGSQAMNAGKNVAAISAAGDAAPVCRRHVNSCDGDSPYRRAVAETRRGPSKLSATIRRFSSSV